MSFWDTSAIVPLCLRETTSAQLSAIADADRRIAVWWATSTECISAIARRQRERSPDITALVEAQERLRRLRQAWYEVPPTSDLRATAERLLSVHPLRAADVFQLAAALQWAENMPAGLVLVSLDARLRSAAAIEGFSVLPEVITLM